METPYSPYAAHGAPPHAQYPPPSNFNSSFASTTFSQPRGNDSSISRTPSPTPSEQEELLRDGLMDWKRFANWRFWVRREWLWYYVIGGVITIITILIAVYDKQIIRWLTPAANWMKRLKFGWLIPIALFFIVSFPPLFGQEIIAILCGVVWGLWIGFAIVAAGTFLGELGNFYAFKYCCRARGEKLEKENLNYACLAKVVRDGGFLVALICRLSVMPGHFTTAIFSTCGMGVITFSIACILSMPKQLITVYIGVVLEETGSGTESSRQKLISDTVLGVTIAVTVGAMWYLLRKMRLAKPDVIYARRKARQGKVARANSTPYGAPHGAASGESVVFNPNHSDSNIPLNATSDQPYQHQQWGQDGRAIGFTGDPRILAPEPQRPQAHVLNFQSEAGGGYSGGDQQYDNSGVGTTYPKALAQALGRTPVRQESNESAHWDTEYHAPNTFDSPLVISPQAGHEPLHDPFENTYAPSSGPPPPVPTSVPHLPPPSQEPYADYSQPPDIRQSHVFPNPFDDAAAAHRDSHES